MCAQAARRDSKIFPIADNSDGGWSASVPSIDKHRAHTETAGPWAQEQQPRGVLLSMSDYKGFDVYDTTDYTHSTTVTRPDDTEHAYSPFASGPPTYNNPSSYAAAQAQVPTGLPQSSATLALAQSGEQYATHDPAYYDHQAIPFPAYLDAAPRPVPEVTNWTPRQGNHGTKITVFFQSVYDFDAPAVAPVIMFGGKRCPSVLHKSHPQGQVYAYSLSAEAPPLGAINSPTTVPLSLAFDDGSVAWEPPSIEFGDFLYLPDGYYQLDSPQMSMPQQQQQQQMPARKRKLSVEASPRRSPTKLAVQQHMGQRVPNASSAAHFRHPSASEVYHQARRISASADYQQPGYGSAQIARLPSQQYYGQPTSALQTTQSPSWSYQHGAPNVARSPSTGVSNASRSSQLLPSPVGSSAPPLIRTSTLQQQPTSPGPSMHNPIATFNPYAMYPSNTKALLKIEGDLNSMSEKWTSAERESQRRLVQFRRSQEGTIISASFEPVALEERIPNSICVSCIWWKEKQECYVTSVDTIALLESLVAVRFTVEEKNRIRRNLEGFRPATVSKTKQENEDFFKLIMAFPNPKPRNIEKDVKVFPWRILATALKKIIGKYSASYSSTAAGLPPMANYAHSRPSDQGLDQHPTASPRSISSSPASRGHHAYSASTLQQPGVYNQTAAIAGLAAPPPTRYQVPTTSWHHNQPSSSSPHDLMPVTAREWSLDGFATSLSGSAPAYPYQHRVPSLTAPTVIAPTEGRFVPLHHHLPAPAHHHHGYNARGQQTSTS